MNRTAEGRVSVREIDAAVVGDGTVRRVRGPLLGCGIIGEINGQCAGTDLDRKRAIVRNGRRGKGDIIVCRDVLLFG